MNHKGILAIDGADALLEVRPSPRPILAAIVILSALLYIAVEVLAFPYVVVSQTVMRFLILCMLCFVSWQLTNWREMVGRWATVAVASLGIIFTGLGLREPIAMALMALIPLVTLGLISPLAAAVVAVAVSGVMLPAMWAVGEGALATWLAILATWIGLGTVLVIVRPLIARIGWLEGYFQDAQRHLEEARDRRAAYEQALEDLTHANRQLVLMNQRVAGLREIAEEAQESKTRFVARVSHEFRTPLNMIIGLVDLMITSPEIYDVVPSPRMREALRVVHRNSEHLSDMINDVLDLTRLEMDRMVLHKERVDLSAVLESTTEAVSPLLNSKGLSLRCEIPSDLPPVYCDRTRIEQVILNLLSNAARYTDRGGIEVTVIRSDHRVRVSVADTGPGIRAEDVTRIFEPFCQGTSDLWRDRGGSGLGLSISKQFVELHGGQMWVESEFGEGTVFSFDLPISPPLGPVAKPGHQIHGDWVWRERQTRPTFPDIHYSPRFIVYDETGDLGPSLTSWSNEIEYVLADGAAHVQALLADAPASAVLLNGPDLSWVWEQAAAIRGSTEGTPVIGCSVVCDHDRSRSLGVLDHLVKPVSRDDLKGALRAVTTGVRHVLIVDDDPDALTLFTEMLRTCEVDLQISQARSGQTALEQLRAAPPDLLLLDLVMPDGDGWYVLETMREDETIAAVPTFLISAQDPRDRLACSDFVIVSAAEGIVLPHLVQAAQMMSELLIQSGGKPDPAPQ
jgi:signal transduction histidine kinase/CheY-like chemotaxis protein